MGGKSSPPPAPDYRAAALAEGESSKENLAYQTYANRPDQYSPWGSQTWSNQMVYDPSTKQNVMQWSQDTNLTPDAQWALDNQMYLQGARSELGGNLMGRAFSEFGTPLDYSQLNPWEESIGGADVRDRAEDAMYTRATSRLDPRLEQSRDSLEATLVNRGLRPGDPVYDREMENLGRAETDAYQTAMNEAIMAGGGEATREQALMLQQANFANQLRQAQLSETQGMRGQSLNEINALIAGQQVAMPSQPNFANAGASQPIDYTGAAANQYSGALDQYSADQARAGGLMSGLGSIAGAGITAWSDRRLKRHIERIGSYLSYPFYRFQYVWGEWSFGVMADEVNPGAVVNTLSGFDKVNYSRIM